MTKQRNIVFNEYSLEGDDISSYIANMNLEFLQAVALSVANERSLDSILKRIVAGLADTPEMVLARIWLQGPGDICETCPSRSECPSKEVCLHLVASDGRPLSKAAPRPTRLDGLFRRFPLGVRKVGKIAESGESLLFTDVDRGDSWVRDSDWVEREGVRSFAGQPLIFRGEILGVLVVFSRSKLTNSDLAMLRTFADNGASAIANARAFENVDRLRQQLEAENEYLRERVQTPLSSEEIIGRSSAIQKVLQQIELVAPTESTILIQGESGTGKELVAREVHRKSKRRSAPLIRVNCATIPAELFESEFFGHVKGSFTGAVRDRIGRFQAADGGTLFLDEVGEIPLGLQSKLLRVLQEGEFEAVGEDVTRSVDVRIIAATNRDLRREVDEGRFREDLYYRLSVFPIDIPALRHRRGDIGLLASHFVERIAERLSIPVPALKKKHVNQLESYDWPGNIRELENAIERALITQRGNQLDFNSSLGTLNNPVAARISRPKLQEGEQEPLTADEMKAFERQNIISALTICGWKIRGKDGAAAMLGIKPTTLSSKMKAMGISRGQN